MTYEEARGFLDEISKSGIVLGTEPMKRLLERVGNPQDQLKFVHIAGTNGKGSTLAFISTILHEAGYTVGRYASPRVFAFEEFVQVNGENIEQDAFCRLTEKVKAAVDSIDADGLERPTLFEVETTIGFLYFIEKQCDIVVLECGMGGRDDATNIVETVVCNVLAPIGMDHMGFLGNTIEEIADVKSGIIRNNAPVCVGRQPDSVLEVIRKACEPFQAPMSVIDESRIHAYDELDFAEDGAPMIHFDYKEMKDLRIRLVGRYQLVNAALAIETAMALDRHGMPVSEAQIRAGLLKAVWPGRFDTIAQNPRIVLDGAHNPHGVAQLKESVEYYFGDKKVYGIMGVLADKAYDEECEMMAPLFEKFFTITPPNNPRALAADKLAEVLRKYHDDVTAFETIEEAVAAARAVAQPEDIIMIFGSLSYIGEASRAVKANL